MHYEWRARIVSSFLHLDIIVTLPYRRSVAPETSAVAASNVVPRTEHALCGHPSVVLTSLHVLLTSASIFLCHLAIVFWAFLYSFCLQPLLLVLSLLKIIYFPVTKVAENLFLKILGAISYILSSRYTDT